MFGRTKVGLWLPLRRLVRRRAIVLKLPESNETFGAAPFKYLPHTSAFRVIPAGLTPGVPFLCSASPFPQ